MTASLIPSTQLPDSAFNSAAPKPPPAAAIFFHNHAETPSSSIRYARARTHLGKSMPAFIADPLLLLTRKLETLARLDEAEREALASLNFRTEEFEAGRYLVREGDDASACCLLVEGYACRHKLADDGGRQ